MNIFEEKSFETFGLSSEILKALMSLHYFYPTAVQEAVVPLVESDEMLNMEQLASFHMKSERASIRMEASEENTPQILHSYIKVEEASKQKRLLAFLTIENPDACFVFCNTKDTGDVVVNH